MAKRDMSYTSEADKSEKFGWSAASLTMCISAPESTTGRSPTYPFIIIPPIPSRKSSLLMPADIKQGGQGVSADGEIVRLANIDHTTYVREPRKPAGPHTVNTSVGSGKHVQVVGTSYGHSQTRVKDRLCAGPTLAAPDLLVVEVATLS